MTDDVAAPIIKPISELFRADCVALWATTYNLDLALFNEYLLRRLGDPPLNAVVLSDRDRLDATLDAVPPERLDLLGPVNRQWLLRGVRLGAGRFHPKSYLAVTPRAAKLLVGSGNLSTNGLDTGRDLFTSFIAGTPHGDAAIATWRSWMRRMVAEVDDTRLAERFADLEDRLPEVAGPKAVVDSPLWHNLDHPLTDQLCDAITAQVDTIDQLIVTAPYYDEYGQAVGQLAARLSPRQLCVYTTSYTSVDGNQLAARLAATGADIVTLTYLPDRFTHAKLVGAVSQDRGWLLSGSANLSRAALALQAGAGNVELAICAELTADAVRAAFLPPDVTAEARPLSTLTDLTFDSGAGEPAPTAVRITTATLLADGRIHVATDPMPESTWRLADHTTTQQLTTDGHTATTAEPLGGPLVHIVDANGDVLSNRVVIDDPEALAHALRTGERSGSGRPPELTHADLDTPLGQALLWLHQNMVMDVAERAGAGSTAATRDEATGHDHDESLWDRLEREKLGRDPRAGTYLRLLGREGRRGNAPSEPLIELLDAMRHRVPAEADPGGGRPRSLLELLARHDNEPGDGDATSVPTGGKWSPSARIRVRARNVLRRWAAAQTDPRLVWVDPLAPLGNLTTIAAVFTTLWRRNAEPDAVAELEDTDLDDLWAQWFQPFVGTGQNDGWLDRSDIADDRLRMQLAGDFGENVTALCWLAIRPGRNWRERTVAWQPYLRMAFDKGVIDVNNAVADYLTVVTGRSLTADRVTDNLLEALVFTDDNLWCNQTAATLGLGTLDLHATTAGQQVSVRLNVHGVEQPLYDPRIPNLIVAVRQYRSADAVALFGQDHDWRLAVSTGDPATYLANLAAEPIESSPLQPGDIEALAADHGVLGDLFPSRARVA